MDFDFYMPVKVVSGKGCMLAQADLMKKYGVCCGIVTGGSSAKRSGALYDAISALSSCGISYCIFDGIKPNPATKDCYDAACRFREAGVEFIMGIGGGSAQDASKAIAAMTVNPELGPDDVYKLDFRVDPLPIVLVGTSAGTGSEVSMVSVLTNTDGMKKSIKAPSLYASLVYADSTYTHTMPYAVTVSTALDALAHAVEGFLTDKCKDITSMFAYKGIPMLWNSLTWLREHKDCLPDESMRRTLYYGSLYAGIVLNACGTVFPHPMGYILTESYGVPHGKACTAFMPALIDRAKVYKPERVKELLDLIGTDCDSFCREVEELTALPDISMTAEQAEQHSKRWATAPNNFKMSPGGFTAEDAEKLLVKMFVK